MYNDSSIFKFMLQLVLIINAKLNMYTHPNDMSTVKSVLQSAKHIYITD